jgi:DNA-binding LacI/PurR family transcriptional regulator
VIEGLGFSTVTAADEKGSYDAIHTIIKSGYTKLAHLAGYSYTNIGKNRLNGFKKAMQDNDLDVNKSWIIETGFSESDGYKGFLKLFRSGTLPEVIFTVTYPVALGVLLAAQEAGISVPDDIQLLSFGGSIYNRFISPSISYIEQPSEEIGKKATELLISEIKSPDMREEQQIIIPTELVICETCKNVQE